MATSDALRRQRLITTALTKQPEAVADIALLLWRSLAVELTRIIGERGFASLYSRSSHLANQSFSWVTTTAPGLEIDVAFAILGNDLNGRAALDSADAGRAAIALLTTFADILAVLIGEGLTAAILRAAWGDEAMDTAEKELP